MIDYVHYADVNVTIKDILCQGQWHQNFLASPLTVDIKNKLIIIILDETVDDVYIQGPATDGVYNNKFSFHQINKYRASNSNCQRGELDLDLEKHISRTH